MWYIGLRDSVFGGTLDTRDSVGGTLDPRDSVLALDPRDIVY